MFHYVSMSNISMQMTGDMTRVRTDRDMCCLAWMQTKHALAAHFQASRCLQHRSGTTECEGFPASFPLYNLHLKKDMEKARTRSSCWQESHEVHRADMSKSTGLDHLEFGQSTLLEPSVLFCLKDFPANAPKIRPKLAVKIISAKMPMLEWPWCLPSGSTKTVETPAAFPNAMSSAKCQRETHKCIQMAQMHPMSTRLFCDIPSMCIRTCKCCKAALEGESPTISSSRPRETSHCQAIISSHACQAPTGYHNIGKRTRHKNGILEKIWKLWQPFNRIYLGI